MSTDQKTKPGSLHRFGSASQSSSLKILRSLALGKTAGTIQCSLSRDQPGRNVIPQTTLNTRKNLRPSASICGKKSLVQLNLCSRADGAERPESSHAQP